jgi:hypothetical protein
LEPDLPLYLHDDEDAPAMVDGDAEDALGHAIPVEEEKALLALPHHSIDPIAVMQEAQVA